MTSRMRWLVGSVAAVALTGAFLGTRTLLAQEQGKGKPPAPAAGAPAAKGQDEKKKHEENMAALRKLIPTAKTTLAAAVEAAEKKSKGKAFEVSYGLTKDSKLALNVELFVEDKEVVVGVDPMTGVAADPKAEHKEEAEEDDDD